MFYDILERQKQFLGYTVKKNVQKVKKLRFFQTG